MAKPKMNVVDWIAWALLIVGGLNWGLAGVFNYNVVVEILMAGSLASQIVYGAVGVSAVYWLIRPFTLK